LKPEAHQQDFLISVPFKSMNPGNGIETTNQTIQNNRYLEL